MAGDSGPRRERAVPPSDLPAHRSGDLTLNVASKPAVSLFDDNLSYWVNGDPGDAAANGRYQSEWSSVNNPHTGTKIRVLNTSSHDQFMQVRVE